MDPARVLLDAMRRTAEPSGRDGATALATVTGGDAGNTGVYVRFDGETAASTRLYRKTYAPTAAGDRVVMLRVGSTWVATARLPETSGTLPDTGWIVPSLQGNWVPYDASQWLPRYRRLNGVVFLRGLIRNTASLPTQVMFNLPAGFRPFSNQITSTAVPGGAFTTWLYVEFTGNVHTPGNTTALAGEVWTSISTCFVADA